MILNQLRKTLLLSMIGLVVFVSLLAIIAVSKQSLAQQLSQTPGASSGQDSLPSKGVINIANNYEQLEKVDIVAFTAPWDSYSVTLIAELNKLSNEYDLVIANVDAYSQPQLVQQWQVSTVPAVVAIKGEKRIVISNPSLTQLTTELKQELGIN